MPWTQLYSNCNVEIWRWNDDKSDRIYRCTLRLYICRFEPSAQRCWSNCNQENVTFASHGCRLVESDQHVIRQHNGSLHTQGALIARCILKYGPLWLVYYQSDCIDKHVPKSMSLPCLPTRNSIRTAKACIRVCTTDFYHRCRSIQQRLLPMLNLRVLLLHRRALPSRIFDLR